MDITLCHITIVIIFDTEYVINTQKATFGWLTECAVNEDIMYLFVYSFI